jgi:hypothetical protein
MCKKRRRNSLRSVARALAMAVWIWTVTGCGPEGVGTITLPKGAGAKGFSPKGTEDASPALQPAAKKSKDEPPADQLNLPKAARRKG